MSVTNRIFVRGARTHNLKNIDLELPRDQLIVMTGLSGSGKSSLAFDTLYAEGQRRYVESLSTYARQFLSMMEKPDVDQILGLSPAIAIEQKSTSHNPRSTVGTVTEIYDYFRLLYARAGIARCPTHQVVLQAQTVSQMVDQMLKLDKAGRWMLLAPIVKDRKGEHIQVIENLTSQGFIRARIDGVLVELDDAPLLDKKKKHSIDVVVDRFKVKDGLQQRLAESVELCLDVSGGMAMVCSMDDDTGPSLLFSAQFACTECEYALPDIEPRLFSFNNPAGACQRCNGLGVDQFFDQKRVVQNPSLSINEGAIRGWDRRHVYHYQMLLTLAEHYAFDIDSPFERLDQKIQTILLHGSNSEKINFSYTTQDGTVFSKQKPFEGVLPNLERRYKETESQAVRDELSQYLSTDTCRFCQGSRLKAPARHVYIEETSINDCSAMTVDQAIRHFSSLSLEGARGDIAKKILKEICERLQFLTNVGLGYLTLDRNANSLSGGEAQRIRLASQIGAGLVGVMYILDEPSIGLHQRDNDRLLNTLIHLRDLGNTVIVVEHDEEAISQADYVVDMGPGAGVHGGEIVAQGTPLQIKQSPQSVTGQYLSGKKCIKASSRRRLFDSASTIALIGASGHNLKSVNLTLPLGLLTCITGVSGSGKSTLVTQTLYPVIASALNRSTHLPAEPFEKIEGLDQLDKIVEIDQKPIGRTPRSNPATYTGVFGAIRELFAGTKEARARGYLLGRFSFNVKGGRCEACQGDGVIKVEMHFLADMYVTCDQCKEKRYNRETLEVFYKNKNIFDVLSMTIESALDFFSAIPVIARKLQTLVDVGLSYLTLGQSATTLSGGEAQRIKLAKELSKKDTGNTLYILDEPTTGLHFQDIQQLLNVLYRLRDRGNTLVVIEHNLDVIKTADWVIDLGPEGGGAGGQIIAKGTPEQIVDVSESHTGRFLKKLIKTNI